MDVPGQGMQGTAGWAGLGTTSLVQAPEEPPGVRPCLRCPSQGPSALPSLKPS